MIGIEEKEEMIALFLLLKCYILSICCINFSCSVYSAVMAAVILILTVGGSSDKIICCWFPLNHNSWQEKNKGTCELRETFLLLISFFFECRVGYKMSCFSMIY